MYENKATQKKNTPQKYDEHSRKVRRTLPKSTTPSKSGTPQKYDEKINTPQKYDAEQTREVRTQKTLPESTTPNYYKIPREFLNGWWFSDRFKKPNIIEVRTFIALLYCNRKTAKDIFEYIGKTPGGKNYNRLEYSLIELERYGFVLDSKWIRGTSKPIEIEFSKATTWAFPIDVYFLKARSARLAEVTHPNTYNQTFSIGLKNLCKKMNIVDSDHGKAFARVKEALKEVNTVFHLEMIVEGKAWNRKLTFTRAELPARTPAPDNEESPKYSSQKEHCPPVSELEATTRPDTESVQVLAIPANVVSSQSTNNSEYLDNLGTTIAGVGEIPTAQEQLRDCEQNKENIVDPELGEVTPPTHVPGVKKEVIMQKEEPQPEKTQSTPVANSSTPLIINQHEHSIPQKGESMEKYPTKKTTKAETVRRKTPPKDRTAMTITELKAEVDKARREVEEAENKRKAQAEEKKYKATGLSIDSIMKAPKPEPSEKITQPNSKLPLEVGTIPEIIALFKSANAEERWKLERFMDGKLKEWGPGKIKPFDIFLAAVHYAKSEYDKSRKKGQLSKYSWYGCFVSAVNEEYDSAKEILNGKRKTFVKVEGQKAAGHSEAKKYRNQLDNHQATIDKDDRGYFQDQARKLDRELVLELYKESFIENMENPKNAGANGKFLAIGARTIFMKKILVEVNQNGHDFESGVLNDRSFALKLLTEMHIAFIPVQVPVEESEVVNV
jgi:hypothetical protein